MPLQFQVTPNNVDIAKVAPTYHLYTPAEVEAVISRLWEVLSKIFWTAVLFLVTGMCCTLLCLVRENLRFSATLRAFGTVFTDSLQINYGTFLMVYCKLRWTIWLVLLRNLWTRFWCAILFQNVRISCGKQETLELAASKFVVSILLLPFLFEYFTNGFCSSAMECDTSMHLFGYHIWYLFRCRNENVEKGRKKGI